MYFVQVLSELSLIVMLQDLLYLRMRIFCSLNHRYTQSLILRNSGLKKETTSTNSPSVTTSIYKRFILVNNFLILFIESIQSTELCPISLLFVELGTPKGSDT